MCGTNERGVICGCDTDPLFTVQLQEEEPEEEEEEEQLKEAPSQTGHKFNVPQALR